MNKRRGSVFIFLGIFCIVAAFCLIGFNRWTEYLAGKQSGENVAQLAGMISESGYDNTKIKYPDYVLNPNMDMPIKEMDGVKYIGILEIPALGLELPVQSEWSDANMKISPCRYDGSVYLDNMVICAHNYRTYFGKLKSLSVGDEVSFIDVEGNAFEYQVAETEILQPTDVEEMTSGDWSLTLFTCSMGGTSRVTVRCKKIER